MILGLACFLLFRAFMDVVTEYSSSAFEVVNMAEPPVFVGGRVVAGCYGLVYLWCRAFGRSAGVSF